MENGTTSTGERPGAGLRDRLTRASELQALPPERLEPLLNLPDRLDAATARTSRMLAEQQELMAEVAKVTATKGVNPPRPPFWGGYRITPVEIEFWADGAHRLHDRFRWTREAPGAPWAVVRLNP